MKRAINEFQKQVFLEWPVFCLQLSPKTVKIYSKTNTNLFCTESLAKKIFGTC